jgi:hypothetical protein
VSYSLELIRRQRFGSLNRSPRTIMVQAKRAIFLSKRNGPCMTSYCRYSLVK